jgi:hypothetical protein
MMNSQIHLLIVTTLSMTVTFVMYCNLKDMRAADSYLQRTLFDMTRESILFVRCLLNSKKSKFIERMFCLFFMTS